MKPAFRTPWRCLCLLIATCAATPLHAHPILDDNHHRTIAVRLVGDPTAKRLRVLVNYRLEEDQWIALLKDRDLLEDRFDIGAGNGVGAEKFEEFARLLGPVLARGMQVKVDDVPVALSCKMATHRTTDEDGKDLQHLRCDFLFEGQTELGEGRSHSFAMHEGNFVKDAAGKPDRGQLRLSLSTGNSVRLIVKNEPAASLRDRPPEELTDEEYASLRDLSAGFELSGDAETEWIDPPEAPTETGKKGESSELVRLFLNSRAGILATCLLAFVLGAFHALTPGHGKTLVAAYLVGEHGTIWHACLLGLTTTLTHTGAVLVLAVVFRFAPLSMQKEMEKALGLVMGLLIAGLGLWLLLRRLGGKADHVHLGGHAHSHDHGPHSHSHIHVHQHTHAAGQGVSWVGLILLGIQGGLVPCWDAVVMLLTALAMNLLWLALPLLLAFSAGLAVVLVTIGIMVVCAKGFAGSRWGESRLFRALPILSAGFISGLGLVLCYRAVHP